ncbi:MAG: hypothetical protein PHQ40_18395, partial [Anaerolineaceae bacterium]|nr:hypothetical protein [Anaerolineaceae bacterium]
TDARNNTTVTLTNAFGQVLKVTPPTGGPAISYEYYPTGNLYKVKQPKDATSTWDTVLYYDLAGRKTSMDDPDMGYWSYTYDAVGNLLTQVDTLNNSICMFYDTGNRLKGKLRKPSGQGGCPGTDPGTYDVSYDYDAYLHGGVQISYVDKTGVTQTPTSTTVKGLRTAMHDATGNTIWLYDGYGRVMREVRELANSLSSYEIGYSYHANSDLMKSITHPTGEEVFIGYDNRKLSINLYLGQLDNPSHYFAGGAGVASSPAQYDQSGRLTTLTLGNGLTLNNIYNPVDGSGIQGAGTRLHTIQVGSLLNFTYTYDPNGNILSITDSINSNNQLTNYSYDGLNRLTTAIASSISGVEGFNFGYGFDTINGRMSSKTENGSMLSYSYDPSHPHAATAVGSNSYVYDGRGNMATRTENGISYTQTWTIENKLRKVTWTQNGDHETTFVYDADGNRVMQIQRITMTSGYQREVTTLYIGGIYEIQKDTTNANSGLGLTAIYTTLE